MCQPARELGINAHRYHTDGGSLTDAHRGPAFLSDSVTHWLSDSNCPLSDFYYWPVCSNPQIAAKVVLDESVKCVEQELAHLDQEFRIDRPPKKITIESEEPMAASEAEAEFAD